MNSMFQHSFMDSFSHVVTRLSVAESADDAREKGEKKAKELSTDGNKLEYLNSVEINRIEGFKIVLEREVCK